MTTQIIITVRNKSTRLPGKSLLPFCFEDSNESVIEHVVNRAKLLKKPITICTGSDESNTVYEEIALNLGITIFRGHEENKVKRWYECLSKMKLDRAHFLDCDDPFFSVDEIAKSIQSMETKKISVKSSDQSETGNASVGNSLLLNHLEIFYQFVRDYSEFEMIDDLWNLLPKNQWIKAPDVDPVARGTRLTLDYLEDYLVLSMIKRKVGTKGNRIQIAEVLRNNPWINEINSNMSLEWRIRQQAIIKHQRSQ